MNIFIFTGNLGSDPEVRATQSGTMITTFSVAATSGWGNNKKTTWVKCALFGKKGGGDTHPLTPYLHKGLKVTVSGEIHLSEWDRRDGGKGYTLECAVRDLELPPKAEGQQQGHTPPSAPQEFTVGDDEIPFANPYKGYEYLS